MEQEIGVEFTKVKGRYYMSSQVDAYVVTLRSYYKELETEIGELEGKVNWLEDTRAQERIKMDESLANGVKELKSARRELDAAHAKTKEANEELDNVRGDLNAAREELNKVQGNSKAIQEELHSTQEELITVREKMNAVQEELNAVQEELKAVQEELKAAQEELSQVKTKTEIAPEEASNGGKQETTEIDILEYRSEKYLSIIDSAVQMADAYVETIEKKMDELLKETEEETAEKLDQARHQSFDIIREANRKAELMESNSQENVNKLLGDARKEYAEIRALIEKASQEYAQITANNNFIF